VQDRIQHFRLRNLLKLQGVGPPILPPNMTPSVPEKKNRSNLFCFDLALFHRCGSYWPRASLNGIYMLNVRTHIHCDLRNIPRQHKSHLLHVGSLNSRKYKTVYEPSSLTIFFSLFIHNLHFLLAATASMKRVPIHSSSLNYI